MIKTQHFYKLCCNQRILFILQFKKVEYVFNQSMFLFQKLKNSKNKNFDTYTL